MIDLYKSWLITIETPPNHTSSQHQIVFAILEKYVGIGKQFLISKKGLSFQSTLTALPLWAHIRATFFVRLCKCVVSSPIFAESAS
jgi:hypothetical protein